MHADVALLDLRLRRRSMVLYTLGMVIYALVVIAIYPSLKTDSSLESLTTDNQTFAALMGVSGSLTSPVGWMNGNLYANFLPLIILLMTIGFGSACLAGQSEDGTLGLVATLPVTRRRLASEKVLALLLFILPLALAMVLCVIAGRHWDLGLGIWAIVGTTIAVVLLGLDFGLLAIFMGVISGSRGFSIGVAASVAAISYLISSLAPIVGVAHSLRWLSPFYWAIGNDQLASGPSPLDFLVLLMIAVVLYVATLLFIDRFDIQ